MSEIKNNGNDDNYLNNSLTENEVKNIYGKHLAVSPSEYFDEIADSEMIENTISVIFESRILLIDSGKLLDDKVLLNECFYKLMVALKEKNYKKVDITFITFCDFFSLDFNKTFLSLHEKLRKIVENHASKSIGVEVYKRMKDTEIKEKIERQGFYQPTLFELAKKKRKDD